MDVVCAAVGEGINYFLAARHPVQFGHENFNVFLVVADGRRIIGSEKSLRVR